MLDVPPDAEHLTPLLTWVRLLRVTSMNSSEKPVRYHGWIDASQFLSRPARPTIIAAVPRDISRTFARMCFANQILSLVMSMLKSTSMHHYYDTSYYKVFTDIIAN